LPTSEADGALNASKISDFVSMGGNMALAYAALVVALVLICMIGLNYLFPEFTARQLLALRLKVMGFSDNRVRIPGFNIA
jgi:hypothetical protein